MGKLLREWEHLAANLAIMHLWKMINTFQNNHPEKLIAMFLPLDFVPSMAKPTVKPITKQKPGRPTQSAK